MNNTLNPEMAKLVDLMMLRKLLPGSQIAKASDNSATLLRVLTLFLVVLALVVAYYEPMPRIVVILGIGAVLTIGLWIAHVAYKNSPRYRCHELNREIRQGNRANSYLFGSNDCHLVMQPAREIHAGTLGLTGAQLTLADDSGIVTLDLTKTEHQITVTSEVRWPTVSLKFVDEDREGNLVPGPVFIQWPVWMLSQNFLTYTNDNGARLFDKATVYSPGFFRAMGQSKSYG